jgi:hypothetical protein
MGNPDFPRDTTREIHPPHEKHDAIAKLSAKLAQELESGLDGIEIPFVTLAMTSEEANELITNPEFPLVNGVNRDEFHQFIEDLRMPDDDILAHYDANRDHWKPYILQQEDTRIETLVKSLLEDVNANRRALGQIDVYAKFYTQGYFTQDNDVNELLYEYGCILIGDALSLFHPVVWGTHDRSSIRNRKEKAPMIVLVPDLVFKTPMSSFIEHYLRGCLGWHFTQFEQNLFKLYELRVGDLTTFRRRLFAMMPDAIHMLQNDNPDPDSMSALRRLQKISVGKVIFGGGK